MSSDSEPAAKKKNKQSRLCFDSENERNAEESEEERRQRKQEKIQRKREKEQQRERRHQQKLQREREAEREEEQNMPDINYQVLLQEDSNSHITFSRVRQNIKLYYPDKKDHWEEKYVEKKPKKESKPKKLPVEATPDKDSVDTPPPKVKAAPAKPNPKEQVVYQFAKRWWYVLPNDWPPKDFDYQAQLNKEGYRLVTFQQFRKEPQVVEGLTKVHQVDGFPGVYKSPTQIVDARPKDSCPSIENFKKRPVIQLMEMTRTALERQIEVLAESKHKQQGDDKLMRELQELLHKYKS